MKRCVWALLSICLLAAFSGCESILERDYASVEKHEEPYVEEDSSSAVVVSNYNGLKAALLYYIGEGLDNGVVRVYTYDGDVSSDLVDACLEIRQDTPLGAWAVDYISHEKANFVSYTEFHIYFTYRRTAGQIKALVSTNLDGLPQAVRESLEAYEDFAAFKLAYFTKDESYVQSILNSLVYELDYPVRPEFKVALYPESGVARIVEVETVFPGGREQFIERAGVTAETVAGLTAGLEGSEAEKYRALFDALLNRAAFDYAGWEKMLAGEYTVGYDSGAFGALVAGSATSRGFAEAYLSLCRACGLNCSIIKGTRSGADWYWNMVKLDDAFYHIDASSAAVAGGTGFFLVTDAEMETVCQWNRTQTEAAESAYFVSPAAPEEVPEDSDDSDEEA
ncbi:MAG: transglutaminase domain-containing protein [Oscillospiraceae bacterium]